MSLDFDLIEQSVAWSTQQLQQKQTITPALAFLHSFLEPRLLSKLLARIELPMCWQDETIEDGSLSYPNRKKVNWEAESVVEELHCVFQQLTPIINQTYSRSNEFLSISIWQDLPGYSIGPHRDNPIIDVAIQIYLGSGPADLGTEFAISDQWIRAPYHQNLGYIMDNRAGIEHRMLGKIAPGQQRFSIYAIWKNG